MAIDTAHVGLSLRSDENRPSLAISGHVVESDVNRIVSALDHLTEEHQQCVSLDFSEVDGIDAAALYCLADSASNRTQPRQRLHFRQASEEVRRSLNHHPLSDLFCFDERCYESNPPQVSCRMDVFSLPSDTAYCREARRRVRDVARQAGLDDDCISDVLLAVGEAVANAIKHGHSGREDSAFTVSCLAAPDKLSVSVSDNGRGFKPDVQTSREVSWFAESGRGIGCMRSLVDEVSFSFNGGTTVRLVKNLN